jgi:hypothetical protein
MKVTTADINEYELTYAHALNAARELDLAGRLRLLSELLQWTATDVESVKSLSYFGTGGGGGDFSVSEVEAPLTKNPIRGALADLGPAPTSEEIAEARRAMWSSASDDKTA